MVRAIIISTEIEISIEREILSRGRNYFIPNIVINM